MKKLVFGLALLLVLVSCDINKEESNLMPSGKEQLNVASRAEQTALGYASLKPQKYISSDWRHSIVAKDISRFFKSRSVRLAFDAYTRSKQGGFSDVVLLADFLYNVVVDNAELRNLYPSSSRINFSNLMNTYLRDYPGLEISFVKETGEYDDGYPNIIDDDNFETVSVYSDINTYPSYKNGLQIGKYLLNDEPIDKTILKLQISDVYDVIINTVEITPENANNTYADLLHCIPLKDMINRSSSFLYEYKYDPVTGVKITYPLSGRKVLRIEDIFNFYNLNAPLPQGYNNLLSDGDTPEQFRTVCDRDRLRNGNETIMDVRTLNGKDILRSCDTWCSYWNKNCMFQVDVFIPTKAVTAGEYAVLGSFTRVFTLNEKRLRKGWNTIREIPITQWLYLEGKHGDEMQYTWTGRHRNRGKAQETTVSMGLSSKIGFKIDIATIELGASSNISNKIIRAFEDCPLGNDVARYCSPLKEQKHLGDIDFKLDEK